MLLFSAVSPYLPCSCSLPSSTQVYRPMSCSPRLGFDVVVDKIIHVHRDSGGRTHDTAKGAVAVVSRQLKTSYIEPGGKRAVEKRPINNSTSDETPVVKRRASSDRAGRASSVTPSESSFRPSLSTPLPPSSISVTCIANRLINTQ